jgi:hypothetical protein
MAWVGFEPTIPAFERAKIVHALDARLPWPADDEILNTYCGVPPRGRSIERPLLINGYAYLAVSLPDNGR